MRSRLTPLPASPLFHGWASQWINADGAPGRLVWRNAMGTTHALRWIVSLFVVLIATSFIAPTSRAIPLTGPADPALAGSTLIDFEDQSIGGKTSLEIGSATFGFGPEERGYVDDLHAGSFGTTGQYLANFPGSGVVSPPDDFETMEVAFSTDVTAFGFNFGAIDVEWTISAFDADGTLLEFVIVPANATDGFHGIAHNGGIRTVTLVQTGRFPGFPTITDLVLVDNFQLVPEPSDSLLVLLGLAGMSFRRRYSHHSA